MIAYGKTILFFGQQLRIFKLISRGIISSVDNSQTVAVVDPISGSGSDAISLGHTSELHYVTLAPIVNEDIIVNEVSSNYGDAVAPTYGEKIM